MTFNNNFQQYNNINELTNSCINLYNENREKFIDESIIENRGNLANYIKKFHTDSETLKPEIIEKIEILKKGKPILLMTAHQPNLFPYSGVLRKAVLLDVLEKKLEEKLQINTVSLFFIADQDFTDDRWVKSSVLSSLTRKDGSVTLKIDLPENVLINKAPKPSYEKLDDWKEEILNWIREAEMSINKYVLEEGIKKWPPSISPYDNFEKFWEIVEKAHNRATNYSDFNSYIMSIIVNDYWKCNVMFSRFSECQRIFNKEFNYFR